MSSATSLPPGAAASSPAGAAGRRHGMVLLQKAVLQFQEFPSVLNRHTKRPRAGPRAPARLRPRVRGEPGWGEQEQEGDAGGTRWGGGRAAAPQDAAGWAPGGPGFACDDVGAAGPLVGGRVGGRRTRGVRAPSSLLSPPRGPPCGPLTQRCRRGRETKPVLLQFRPPATSRAVTWGPTTWLARTQATVPSRPGLPRGAPRASSREDLSPPHPGARSRCHSQWRRSACHSLRK